MTRARAEMLLCRALLLATIAAAVVSGGCEMGVARHESMALGDTALMGYGGSAATASEAVFEGPEANALAVTYGRESFPEYSRLDGRMNIYTPELNTATAQWPQAGVPDATSVRYVYLPVRTSSSSMIIPVYRNTNERYWRARGY